MSGQRLQCPNCGRVVYGRRAMVLHLLQEAGAKGVTTPEMLAAGCGTRYSARVDELRVSHTIPDATMVKEGVFRYVLTASAPTHIDRRREPVALPTRCQPCCPDWARTRTDGDMHRCSRCGLPVVAVDLSTWQRLQDQAAVAA